LQAGVNHELHVPPTQVIRLDIWWWLSYILFVRSNII
jgi:hypothetical protein